MTPLSKRLGSQVARVAAITSCALLLAFFFASTGGLSSHKGVNHVWTWQGMAAGCFGTVMGTLTGLAFFLRMDPNDDFTIAMTAGVFAGMSGFEEGSIRGVILVCLVFGFCGIFFRLARWLEPKLRRKATAKSGPKPDDPFREF